MLWFVSAIHIVIGVGVNLVPGSLPFFATMYGADVSWTPEFVYIMKPLGAFMIALGFIAAIAARDPLRFRPVVYAFVLLFVMRSAQRIVFGQELDDVFGIGGARNVTNMAFFLAMAGILIWLERGATHPAEASPV